MTKTMDGSMVPIDQAYVCLNPKSRWKIGFDGALREVRGPGVVGEQPRLEPGDAFEYTSGVPLTTPSGIMSGSYQMQSEHGDCFDVEIPAFSLDSPHQSARFN
jgi:ApaG protein